MDAVTKCSVLLVLSGGLMALVGSCKAGTNSHPATPEASAAQAASADPRESDVSIVSSSVVLAACPDAKTIDNRAARQAIRKLVDPCAKVPGGKAQFSATLKPDGTILLGSPEGNPAEGIVPTCAVQNRLTHRVLLRSPCKFDVVLEERKPSGQAQ